MPKKYLLDTIWFWTKMVSVILLISAFCYFWGTNNPNKSAIAKVETVLDNEYILKIKQIGLHEPSFEYRDAKQFVRAIHKCIDYLNFSTPRENRVPYDMIIGQAVLESGWGDSRFARDGNNLFGIRTFSKDVKHMLLQDATEWPGWGVRVFKTKCDSTKEYLRLLNEHPAYEKFRETRRMLLAQNKPLDSFVLIKTIDKFSTTKDYDQRVIRMINKIRKMEEIR